ncbi:glutaredoxin family protein [Psychrobacter lutiphocae]|uniref:glutaredoxin family protein n=1 Tax=Psychrobacter lutiphocae TaxID=540500 RepID=UPI00037F5849|nr:glutaredoxin family protein [Psychrobacter lutiphocae]
MTDVNTTRQRIIQQLNSAQHKTTSEAVDLQAWWLLGTSGCHLCDTANELLRLFSSVHPIRIQQIDIADFDESLMTQFATTIPVLLTPTTQLKFPFSLVDLQQLI